MIWYLHWLEMRRGAMVSLVGLAIGVAGFFVVGHWHEPSDAHRVALPLPTVLSAVFLAGSGLRGRDDQGSSLYLLSLPVGRKKLMASRLAAGLVLLTAMLALMLALNTSLLALMIKPVPFAAMAENSLLAFVSAVPAMAVGGLLRLYLSEKLATYSIWCLIWALVPQLGLAAKDLPWSNWVMPPEMIISYSAIATAMLVSLTLYVGQRKEF